MCNILKNIFFYQIYKILMGKSNLTIKIDGKMIFFKCFTTDLYQCNVCSLGMRNRCIEAEISVYLRLFVCRVNRVTGSYPAVEIVP